ncbi:hypothetical protein V7128_23505 [Neobacillus vireti]
MTVVKRKQLMKSSHETLPVEHKLLDLDGEEEFVLFLGAVGKKRNNESIIAG